MYKNKQEILNALCHVLKLTSNAADVESISYEKTDGGMEYANVLFEGGGKRKINISMDSGTAMIHDVMQNLGR